MKKWYRMKARRRFYRKLAKRGLQKLNAEYNIVQKAVFANDLISFYVLLDGWFEKHLLEQFDIHIMPAIDKDSIALDMGANIGNHSLWFTSHFSEVHSFEPNLRTFYLLQANAMLASNITVHNVGCSNKPATHQRALVTKTNMGDARLDSSTPLRNSLVETTYFNLVKLDDYLSPELHNRIGLIKCDVEGHEEQALAGAEKIILASEPVIAFEPNDFKGVEKYLTSLGYSHFYVFSRYPRFARKKKMIQITSSSILSCIYRGLVVASVNEIGS